MELIVSNEVDIMARVISINSDLSLGQKLAQMREYLSTNMLTMTNQAIKCCRRHIDSFKAIIDGGWGE